jgi:hypothetical protein
MELHHTDKADDAKVPIEYPSLSLITVSKMTLQAQNHLHFLSYVLAT